MEYKGRRRDLDAAFDQLLQYALAPENPPLLIAHDSAAKRGASVGHGPGGFEIEDWRLRAWDAR